MERYQISSLSEVKAEQAISLLNVLSALPERSIAFFRSSRSEGDQFHPSLSILGFKPSTLLQSKNGIIQIESGGKKTETSGNPFQVFSKLLNERKSISREDLPFFQGGALGYFGYDAVRFVEPVLQKTKNLNLRTERFDAEIAFFKNYVVFNHDSGEVILISEDTESENSFRALFQNLLPQLSSASPAFSDAGELGLNSFQSSFGKESFIEGVKQLKTHIKDGDIFQAVLSEKFRHEFTGEALDLFQALLQVNPAPYQFYFAIDGRTFLGASPEMLLKTDESKIETHPIAGTRPRGKTPEEERKNELELLANEKECAEHLMLVDLARNDIGRVSTAGSVKVESFQKLRKFGSVMHLVSKVTGKLSPSTDSMGAFASCFPAGTLSGAPKIRAMGLLSDMEPESRGFYGGAFIAASVTGDLDSCIAIRSMSIENKIVTIQAGAGIVADSSPEKEYEEIEHKTRLARKALAMALSNSKLGGSP